jgi:hypothetical protein
MERSEQRVTVAGLRSLNAIRGSLALPSFRVISGPATVAQSAAGSVSHKFARLATLHRTIPNPSPHSAALSPIRLESAHSRLHLATPHTFPLPLSLAFLSLLIELISQLRRSIPCFGTFGAHDGPLKSEGAKCFVWPFECSTPSRSTMSLKRSGSRFNT